jgi:hypothetical protein
MIRRFTIERTVTVVVFLLIFAMAARVPLDTDTWWHIRSGEETLQNGFIRADSFSHTLDGTPWVNHSWGAQIILYAAWSLAGYTGLVVYMAGLATLGLVFVWKACTGGTYLRAFAMVLCAATAAVFWSPRPQMLSFALSAVVFWILSDARRSGGRDRLWWLVPIMAVWGNLHAGFSIGFIFMGAFLVGDALSRLTRSTRDLLTWPQLRRLALIVALGIAALCINPYGLQMLAVPFQTVSIGALQNFIQEWNSPNFHERQTWPFLALLFGAVAALGLSRQRITWTEFFLLAGTAFMAFSAGRNIAVFAVAATPIFTLHVDDYLRERGWLLRPLARVSVLSGALNLVIVGVVGAFCLLKVASVVLPTLVEQVLDETYPTEAVAALKEQRPPGTLFNSYNWGGYLIHALPEYPVFVDGRTDLYGDDFLTNAYLHTALGGERSDEVFRQYGVNIVLAETGSGLVRMLMADPAWETVTTDALATLLVRREPLTGAAP